MTAYIVLKQVCQPTWSRSPREDVRYAAQGRASIANLRSGDRSTVEDLPYAMLLASSADADHALARTYGSGIGGFAAKVNVIVGRHRSP